MAVGAVPLAFVADPVIAVVGAGLAGAGAAVAADGVRARLVDPRAWIVAAAALGAATGVLRGLAWQWLPAVVLAAAIVLCRHAGAWRGATSLGSSLRPPWIGAALVTAVAAAGFVVWYVRDQGAFSFGHVGLGLVLAGAAINAVLEEAVWRWAALGLLLRGRVPAGFALAVQAASFGLAHWSNGTPSGAVGAVAASLFGLALGLIAWRTRSLVLPIAVHFLVDVVIIVQVYG